jgi:hypothetical protein
LNTNNVAWVPVVAALLLASPGPAAALGVVEYTVWANSTSGSDVQQSVPAPVNAGFIAEATSGGSNASIRYQPGVPGAAGVPAPVIGLVATTAWPAGDANTTQFGGDHNALASFGIFDTITMQRPAGIADYGATLSIQVMISGSLNQSNGAANWVLSELSLQALPYRAPGFVLVSPVISIDSLSGLSSGSFPPSGQSLPVTVTATKPASASATDIFLYDVPIDFRWRLLVSANGNPAAAGQSGFAEADLGNTAVWLGITARDLQGNIIEDLQFTSESGVNWANAAVVPAPAPVWLLLSALGALGLRAGRSIRRKIALR